jgi:hypothetical protein
MIRVRFLGFLHSRSIHFSASLQEFMMTSRFNDTSKLAHSLAAACLLTLAGQAHAQFGGLFQSVINSAVQQGTQQAVNNAAAAALAGQVSPQAAAAVAGSVVPAQTNALNAAAAAISQNDPEYQALMIQSLAQVPAYQRNAAAPLIDQQVRQTLASRRLGLAGNVGNVTPVNANDNPLANAAVQAALAQGLANNGGFNAAALNSNSGQAAAAGAIIQGLGSLFGSSSAPVQTPAPTQP